tara:strand:+ start:291 stop:620 length:330 start_codon:yes stop_codon:yes gene_type:complete
MKQPPKHTRWHHVDSVTGKKIIRQFEVNATPPAPWIRGTGPHSPEVLAKVQAHIAKTFKGVPKSAEQKEKMSDAKLGTKFTEEHRQNMSISWNAERREKFLLTLKRKKL